MRSRGYNYQRQDKDAGSSIRSGIVCVQSFVDKMVSLNGSDGVLFFSFVSGRIGIFDFGLGILDCQKGG